MANFVTHLYGAAVVSSTAAVGLYGVGLADAGEAQVYFLVGVVGGLLPDIDSDGSTPVRAFFSMLGAALAFGACFALIDRFALVDLALVWSLVFVLVRFGVFEIFARFTVHRGVWHSWLAVLFVSFATADLAYWLAGRTPWESWMSAAFMGLGYLTHLCLDELASVNLLNTRVKRSFGTAMKPLSLGSPWASLTMAAGVVVLALVSPSFAPVLDVARRFDASSVALQAGLWRSSSSLGEWRAWVVDRAASLIR